MLQEHGQNARCPFCGSDNFIWGRVRGRDGNYFMEGEAGLLEELSTTLHRGRKTIARSVRAVAMCRFLPTDEKSVM